MVAGAILAAVSSTGTSLADSFNWADLIIGGGTYSFVSPVKNQGQGNNCWAFCDTAALEAHYMLTRDDPTFSMNLSEQMLVSAPGAGDAVQGSASSGGYPDQAMNFIVSTGLVSQQTLPYLSLNSPTNYSISQATVNSWANQVCKATGDVTDITASTATIKADLKMYGPMAATLIVDNNFWPTDQLESNVGHAILITGYQDNASVPGGGYFIVKNSWGTSPANQNPSQAPGYYEVPYSYIGVDSSHVVDALTGPAFFTGATDSGAWVGGSGTWSGGVGGWSTSGGAWSNGENQAVFNAAGGTISVGSYTSAHGLSIGPNATGYYFTGGPLIVTGSGIAAGASVTINSAVTVGAPQTWTVAAGSQLTISGSLNLNISPLTIAGSGNTLISGPIHDATTDPLLGGAWTGTVGSLTMAGAGTLILTGNNTYAGGTTIASGILEVNGGGALGTGAVTDNSELVFNLSGPSAFAGVIKGNGSLVQTGTGILTLAGSDSYTGGTTVAAGALKLDFSQAGAPAANILNNTSNASSLTLDGAALAIQGNPGASNSQQFHGLSINPGSSSIVLTAAGTSNRLLLSLGTIGRSAGGTVDFTLPGGTQSATNGITTTTANTNGILGGYATVGGANWATWNGTDIVAYSAYTTGNLGALGSGSTLNVEPSGTQTNITSAKSFNTLNLTGAEGVTMSGSGSLNLSAGGLIGNTSGAVTGGTLTSPELIIITPANLTIGSTIADQHAIPTSLTKAGSAILTLSGTNTYSGGTTINGGTLQLASASALGTGGITFSGGNLELDTSSVSVPWLSGNGGAISSSNSGSNTSGIVLPSSPGNGRTLPSGNGGTLPSGGGGAITFDGGGASADITTLTVQQSVTTTFGGTISNGSSSQLIALAIDGPGKLVLSSSNTFSGGTTDSEGTLVLASPAALEAGTSLIVGANASSIIDSAASGEVVAAIPASPAPEPCTLVLLGVAAVGAAAAVWRRRQRWRSAPVHKQFYYS